jgi:uncharacterized protein YceK
MKLILILIVGVLFMGCAQTYETSPYQPGVYGEEIDRYPDGYMHHRGFSPYISPMPYDYEIIIQ